MTRFRALRSFDVASTQAPHPMMTLIRLHLHAFISLRWAPCWNGHRLLSFPAPRRKNDLMPWLFSLWNTGDKNAFSGSALLCAICRWSSLVWIDEDADYLFDSLFDYLSGRQILSRPLHLRWPYDGRAGWERRHFLISLILLIFPSLSRSQVSRRVAINSFICFRAYWCQPTLLVISADIWRNSRMSFGSRLLRRHIMQCWFAYR